MDYTSYYNYTPVHAPGAGFWLFMVTMFWMFFIPVLIIGLISLIAAWRVFEKAKKPGWAAIIPIYNLVVLLQIVGRPIWWVFLFLAGVIPFFGSIVAFITTIVVMNDLAKSFKKDISYTLLLVFLPFIGWPMLAWGDAKYRGPSVKS